MTPSTASSRTHRSSGLLAANLSLAFLVALLALPALVWRHTFPLPAFYQEWLAFAFGLAALLAALFHPRARSHGVPAIALLPVLVLAALLVQSMLGRVAYPEQTLSAALYLVWAAALIWLGSLLCAIHSPPRVVEALASGLAASSIIAALIGIAQYAGIDPPLERFMAALQGERAYGNLTQPNLFAHHLALGLASLMCLGARARLSVAVISLAALPLLLALALSQSRSAWLYLALFLAVALVQRCRTPDAAAAFPQVGFSLALIIGLAAAYALVAALDFAALSFDQRIFRIAGGINDRLELWRTAWLIFLDSPWIGAGFGQFGFERYMMPVPEGAAPRLGLFTHAHNLLLHSLAEFGLFVSAAMLWLAGRWLIAWRAVRLDAQACWILAVSGVALIHSLLEFPLWYANFLGVMALALGIGERRLFAAPSRFAVRAAVGAALLGSVTLASSLTDYRSIERLFVGPQGEAVPSVLLREAERVATRSLFTPYVELAYSGLRPIEAEGIAESLELNTRLLRFMPDDHVAYRQALLLAQSGDAVRAQAMFERGLSVYPDYYRRIAPLVERLRREQPERFAFLAGVTPAR